MDPATPRQIMFLRFWDKSELMDSSQSAISHWVRVWYNEDPDRAIAWALYKEEHDLHDSSDPARIQTVHPRIGYAYLKRVKKERKETSKLKTLREEYNKLSDELEVATAGQRRLPFLSQVGLLTIIIIAIMTMIIVRGKLFGTPY